MSKKTLDLDIIVRPDQMAEEIADKWDRWKSARAEWTAEKEELRNYLFATDTTKTTNSKLPWRNKTTLPKLTQIRDNLHANYMAALFPNEDWFKWEAMDEDSANKDKATIITSYMKNKLRVSKFRSIVSKLLHDYIDYGNAFAEVEYVIEKHTDPVTEEEQVIYSGPRVVRVSPFEIMFDITAPSFDHAPKITRKLISLGELKLLREESPDSVDWIDEAFEQIHYIRNEAHLYKEDIVKLSGFKVDGFGDPNAYYNSGLVELLIFEGTIYDKTSDVLYKNHRIIVADRKFVIYKSAFPSWLGVSNKVHVGWRERPDNLMAMGPLDNLVGIQYRIDHLENSKADAFDQIIFPTVVQYGAVEDWEWGPGERIYADADANVQVLRPDTTALNADFQIQNLTNIMEEFAGAPRQAMGIRTPGEKTAYEIQSLENAAGRIFQNKVQHFEEVFLEPLLNQMLEAARRNLERSEEISIVDPDFGAQEFQQITKQDLQARGKLVPVGARHFARTNMMVQNLTNFMASPAYADPSVAVHISGRRIAQLFEELLGLGRYELVQEYVRISEETEANRLAQTASGQLQQEGMVDPALAAFEDDAMAVEEQLDEEI